MPLTTMLQMLSEGMVTSFAIFVLTLLGSLPLGMVVAFARMSSNPILSGLMRIYISIMRGTPLMLQLFAVYFGPYYLFGIQTSSDWRFGAVITAFIINYAAYFAEIYRSGLLAIPPGQYEAAEVLGYSKPQAFIRIILPQVLRVILPSITNEVITLVKDTSLAFVISVSEMFSVARAIAAKEHNMMAFVVAGVFYYVFNAVVAWVMERVEKHFAYERK